MNKRTFESISRASLFALFACAVLFDRLPRFSWLFGTVGIICAVLSGATYVVYNHRGVYSSKLASVGNRDATSRSEQLLGVEIKTLSKNAQDLAGMRDRVFMYYFDDVTLMLLKEKVSDATRVINCVKPTPWQSFSDHVISIVRGLSPASEAPAFEFEFRPDGTLKVIPCERTERFSYEPEDDPETVRSSDAKPAVN